MLLRRALIRAGFAHHRLLTLSMAYAAVPQGAELLDATLYMVDLRAP
ncbi:MAG: hypothetical protein ACREDU_05250 [Methylocella sp.]